MVVRLRPIIQWGLVHLRAHTALVQLTGVVACIPSLLFPTRVPLWAILGSLAGLALLLVAGYLLGRRAVVRTPVDIPILLLLLLLPMTILITPDRDLTLPHVYKVIGSVALFYGVVGVLEERPWFGLSALTISALGVVLAVLTLFGTRWPTASKLPWLPVELYQILPRLVRPFWNPRGFHGNIVGGTLAMLLPVPLAYLFFGRRPRARLGALLAVGIVGLVLLLTQSRGAIVALAAGVAAMLVARDRRWLVVVVVAVIVGVLVLQFVGVDHLMAVSDTADRSVAFTAQERSEMWSWGCMMLRDFPFTGIGFGLMVKVVPALYGGSGEFEHVHNLYLEAGVDLGFPGLIATLAFLLGLLYLSWRAARRASGSGLEPLALGMLGVVVDFAVHGLTDNFTFYAKAHFIAWALFGVAVAVGSRFVGDGESSAAGAVPRRGDQVRG